jgi:hypothetical protein
MKRPSRSFVVEVRRQRRSPGEPAPSWTEELQKPHSNGAARDLGPAPRAFAEPPAAVAPARPTGRILPSLVEAPPAIVEPAPAKPPKAAKPAKPAKPRGQPRRSRAPAPQPVRFVEPPPAAATPAPIAEPPAEAVGKDNSARHRRILARYVFGDASKPGQRWKRRISGE